MLRRKGIFNGSSGVAAALLGVQGVNDQSFISTVLRKCMERSEHS